MTLEAELKEAAFWHEAICLGCGAHREAEALLDTCDDCGGSMVDAIELTTFVDRLEGERDESEGN